MNGNQLPVDLWIMDVPNGADLPHIGEVLLPLFGGEFRWNYETPDEQAKGVARKLDVRMAEVAQGVLTALGAEVLIDEGAYLDDEDAYAPGISPNLMKQIVLTAIQGLEVVWDTLHGFPPNSVSISVDRVNDEGKVTGSHGTTLGRREVYRLNEERPPVS